MIGSVLAVVLLSHVALGDCFCCPGIRSVSNTKVYAAPKIPADDPHLADAVDTAIFRRYACTRFQRHDGIMNSTLVPSPPNQTVVNMALKALDNARRAPSGFNSQPYKIVLVQSPETKKSISNFCSGKNAYRVRDSDCTVVFLADREVGRNFRQFRTFLEANNEKWKDRKWAMLKLQAVLALFSSGYPLPRMLAVPVSFCVRLGVCFTSFVVGRWVVVPSLSSAETWASKNTMLVAMAYMIGCSARGIATCPMEGIDARGIRRALKIPRRYSIPLIVATGNPYVRPQIAEDDVGMSHGQPGTSNATPRYPTRDMIFCDSFGSSTLGAS